MEAEDEVDDELPEAADTEVIKRFALLLSLLQAHDIYLIYRC
jgi:hypothetical protein